MSGKVGMVGQIDYGIDVAVRADPTFHCRIRSATREERKLGPKPNQPLENARVG
jgi:hypothetical protein